MNVPRTPTRQPPSPFAQSPRMGYAQSPNQFGQQPQPFGSPQQGFGSQNMHSPSTRGKAPGFGKGMAGLKNEQDDAVSLLYHFFLSFTMYETLV